MRISIAFSGFGGLESTFPAVLAAEAAGLDGVWTAEHLGFHDAMVPSAMYLPRDGAHRDRDGRVQPREPSPGSARDGAGIDERARPGARAGAGRHG